MATFVYFRQLCLGQTSGTQHAGKLFLHAVIQQLVYCHGCGEINDCICSHITFVNICEYRVGIVSIVSGIDSRHQFHIGVRCDQSADHLSHFTVTSMHDYFYHFSFLPSIMIFVITIQQPSYSFAKAHYESLLFEKRSRP